MTPSGAWRGTNLTMSVSAIERVDCVYETECLGGMYRNGGLSQATSYEGVTVVVRLIYTIHRTLCFPIIDHRADCSSVPHALIYLICLRPPPPAPLPPQPPLPLSPSLTLHGKLKTDRIIFRRFIIQRLSLHYNFLRRRVVHYSTSLRIKNLWFTRFQSRPWCCYQKT